MLLKTCACLAALIASSAAIASDKPAGEINASINAQDLELIYRLAERPVGVVVADRCEIRGAVWAWGQGPYAGAKQSLVNVMTGETYRVTTNQMGVYSLSVPYPGTPIVFAERIDDEIYVLKEFEDTAKVLNGGVVCDHRLKTQVAQNHSANKETK